MANEILLASMLASCAVRRRGAGIDYSTDLTKPNRASCPKELMVFPATPSRRRAGRGQPASAADSDAADGFGVLFGADDPAPPQWKRAFAQTSLKKRCRIRPVSRTSAYRLWVVPLTGELPAHQGRRCHGSPAIRVEIGDVDAIQTPASPGRRRQVEAHGQAWPDGSAEPAEWMLTWDETEKPTPGVHQSVRPVSGDAVILTI